MFVVATTSMPFSSYRSLNSFTLLKKPSIPRACHASFFSMVTSRITTS